ncbi:hypothetical protein [Lentzea guizhouensis]|nr:hypothetical protein [Lentzea guizhouensis]
MDIIDGHLHVLGGFPKDGGSQRVTVAVYAPGRWYNADVEGVDS